MSSPDNHATLLRTPYAGTEYPTMPPYTPTQREGRDKWVNAATAAGAVIGVMGGVVGLMGATAEATQAGVGITNHVDSTDGRVRHTWENNAQSVVTIDGKTSLRDVDLTSYRTADDTWKLKVRVTTSATPNTLPTTDCKLSGARGAAEKAHIAEALGMALTLVEESDGKLSVTSTEIQGLASDANPALTGQKTAGKKQDGSRMELGIGAKDGINACYADSRARLARDVARDTSKKTPLGNITVSESTGEVLLDESAYRDLEAEKRAQGQIALSAFLTDETYLDNAVRRKYISNNEGSEITFTLKETEEPFLSDGLKRDLERLAYNNHPTFLLLGFTAVGGLAGGYLARGAAKMLIPRPGNSHPGNPTPSQAKHAFRRGRLQA